MTKSWMVVYTKPQHEKKSQHFLEQHGIEVFLPLRKELRQWSDRKKWVERPLFPSYLFVRIANKDYYNVLNCPGIVKYIFHNGAPATVDPAIIKGIKLQLKSKQEMLIEPIDTSLECGQEIEIKTGPFKGLRGKILQIKGKQKLAIEIECMNRKILIETSQKDILKKQSK